MVPERDSVNFELDLSDVIPIFEQEWNGSNPHGWTLEVTGFGGSG